MNTIEVRDLTFAYPDTTQPVLKIANFQLSQGERLFLFGPSGCGKTTLLEIFAGVLPPSSGQVKILGQDLASLTSSRRDAFRADHIGYIFQSFNLIPYLSVSENITLPLYLSEKKRQAVSLEDQQAEVLRLCQRLGISELLGRPVAELSIGQQQRVAAARALLGRPQLILADEPTSSLDFDHREKFIELLFEICRETSISVMFVSHDRSLQKLFDRVVSLADINVRPS